MTAPVPRFPLGRVVGTPGALIAMQNAGVNPADLLRRHVSGDWGDVPAEDAAENELSVREGFRILSSYPLPGTNARIWVITEAVDDDDGHRAATTMLLPDEY
jgi:hypothetical protein